MGTIQCLIDKKYPLDHVLTDEDKKAILEENKGINVSYLSLLREMLSYSDRTVSDVLRGWGGVQLVKV